MGRKVLMQHQDSYALLWTWVASLIGRMSQDGDIPPMATDLWKTAKHRTMGIWQQSGHPWCAIDQKPIHLYPHTWGLCACQQHPQCPVFRNCMGHVRQCFVWCWP